MTEKLVNMKHLIIFTRYPEAGKAKTRLIPVLGAEGAANLHRQMAEKTLTTAKQLKKQNFCSIEVQFTGSDLSLMQQWLGDDLIYHPQSSGDLGDRMGQAFQNAFNQGKTSIITIGTDCPSLTVELLAQAFEQLHHHDLVLGPAEDGGYYLIGLNRWRQELFKGINWGTKTVLQQTLSICHQLNLSVSYLPQLTDIDRPEDLDSELIIKDLGLRIKN